MNTLDYITKYMDSNKNLIKFDEENLLYFIYSEEQIVYIGYGSQISKILQEQGDKDYTHYSTMNINNYDKAPLEIKAELLLKLQPRDNLKLQSEVYKSIQWIREDIRNKYPKYKYESKLYVNNIKKVFRSLGIKQYHFNGKEYYNNSIVSYETLIKKCLNK